MSPKATQAFQQAKERAIPDTIQQAPGHPLQHRGKIRSAARFAQNELFAGSRSKHMVLDGTSVLSSSHLTDSITSGSERLLGHSLPVSPPDKQFALRRHTAATCSHTRRQGTQRTSAAPARVLNARRPASPSSDEGEAWNSPQRSKHVMWMGNVPKDATEAEITQFLS